MDDGTLVTVDFSPMLPMGREGIFGRPSRCPLPSPPDGEAWTVDGVRGGGLQKIPPGGCPLPRPGDGPIAFLSHPTPLPRVPTHLSPVHRLVFGEVGEGGDGFGAFTGSIEGVVEVRRG